jgi:hypothetical protein
MRAVAREELVPHLLAQRHLLGQHVGREQSLEQVVVAAVAVAPRESEHPGDGVRLQQGADDVRRRPEPVGLGAAGPLEIECRQRALGADPLEHPLAELGVVGDQAG